MGLLWVYNVVVLFLIFSIITLFVLFLHKFWLQPRQLRTILMKQGIGGPSPLFFTGSILEMANIKKQLIKEDMGSLTHDILAQVLPEYFCWSKIYGQNFVHWVGPEAVLYTVEPELTKEMGTLRNGIYKSPFIRKDREPLLGNGLIAASGKEWQHQRRFLSPAFKFEKIKGMVHVMERCTRNMLDSIEKAMADDAWTEVEMSQYLTAAMGDIIAQAAFGSNYEAGKTIFQKLTWIQRLIFHPTRLFGLPGARYFPTARNRELWRLQTEVEGLLRQVISERRMAVSNNNYDNDLLGLMLERNEETVGKGDPQDAFSEQILIDQCKTFYFAGHETVSQTITWTMLLLAMYPHWQDQVRAEVNQWNKSSTFLDLESLGNLKTLQMVLNESLRLYPAVPNIHRWVERAIRLEKFMVPERVSLVIPVVALHQNTQVWGEDAHEFRPERFSDGVPESCKGNFLPFGFGARSCVGQNFAVLEMRVLLAMTLHRFRFRVSSNYVHAPITILTLKPMHGLQLLLQKV